MYVPGPFPVDPTRCPKVCPHGINIRQSLYSHKYLIQAHPETRLQKAEQRKKIGKVAGQQSSAQIEQEEQLLTESAHQNAEAFDASRARQIRYWGEIMEPYFTSASMSTGEINEQALRRLLRTIPNPERLLMIHNSPEYDIIFAPDFISTAAPSSTLGPTSSLT